MTKTKEMEPLAPMNMAAALTLAGAFGGNLTPVGLDITDPDLPYESWENLGRCIGFAGNAWQWWAGDWINIGETLFGEQAAQAMDDKASRYDIVRRTIGKEQQTLLNISSVCRKVARPRRRIELSFGHHSVVAPLDPEEQSEWLRLAVEGQWSIAELREKIRDAKNPADGEATGGEGGTDPGRMSHCEQVEQALRTVFDTGQSTSDGHVLVPPSSWTLVATALGEQ